MNATLPTSDDASNELRRLAAAAAPAVTARPDLARVVLGRARRQRRVRRLRNAAIGAGGGIVVLSTLAAAAVLGRSEFISVLQPTTAMGSTVQVGEQVIVNKKLSPVRGDVVYAHVDRDGVEYDVMLRVLALPGDTVGCPADSSGRCAAVVVNGKPVSEPYLGAVVTDPFPTSTVPKRKMFLLGDNRDAASDSRHIGPVDLDAASGVAVQIKDRAGAARTVPGAVVRGLPADNDNVDPAGPVPQTQVEGAEPR
jgi:signal peptidase I